MLSTNIYFTAKEQVDVRQEEVRAPGPGEILLRARKSLISSGTEGICFGRLFDAGTHWDKWVKYPFPPGYGMAAEVAAVGEGVDRVRVGDRVASRTPHREYTVVPAAGPAIIPEGVTDEEAAWFGMASIAQNGVRRAEHALGETVVIVGLGLLGQLVTQYLRLLGAREIIAVDPSALRVKLALAHGATAGIASLVQDVRSELLEQTNGGADAVYDVTGNAEVLQAALPLVRPFGRLALLGDTGRPGQQRLTGDVVTKGLRIVGAHDSNPPQAASHHTPWSRPEMYKLFFQYVARGDLRVLDLITHRFRPEEAAEAYRVLRDERPETLGIVFDWSAEG